MTRVRSRNPRLASATRHGRVVTG